VKALIEEALIHVAKVLIEESLNHTVKALIGEALTEAVKMKLHRIGRRARAGSGRRDGSAGAVDGRVELVAARSAPRRTGRNAQTGAT
jgi:superfamily II DNA/RNA helicase